MAHKTKPTAKEEEGMWTRYEIRFDFVDRLCAGLPADPETQRKMLEARKPKRRPPESQSIDEIAEELVERTLRPESEDQATEEDDRSLHVFERLMLPGMEERVLVLRTMTFRAHIKDVVDVLSAQFIGKPEKGSGVRSFAVRAKNALYYPREIRYVPILDQDGKPLTRQTEIEWDKPIHPKGRPSALKSYEYVLGAVVLWPLSVLTDITGKPNLSEQDLKYIFEFGGTKGYGPERGAGEGKYFPTITKVEGGEHG